MAEAFMAFFIVTADPTDGAASLLMGQQAHKTVTRLERMAHLEEPVGPETADLLAANVELRDVLLEGRSLPPPLEQLARRHSEGLRGWYSRVYRLACEPAHLGDLWEFMPEPDGAISTAPATTATSQATVAAYYGLRVAIATLRAVTEANELGLTVDADALDRRVDEIAGS